MTPRLPVVHQITENCYFGLKCTNRRCKYTHPVPANGFLSPAAAQGLSLQLAQLNISVPAPAPTVVARIKKTRRDKMIVLVIDVSRSMEGTRISTVIECFENLVGMLHGTDQIKIYTFQSTVSVALDWSTVTVLRQRLRDICATIRASVGGMTAFYDAVALSIDDMKSILGRDTKEKQIAFVFMTDGMDNRSSLSLDACARKIRRPGIGNCSMDFVGIELAPCQSAELAMRTLAEPEHCRLVLPSELQLRDAFRTVWNNILQPGQRAMTASLAVANFHQGG